MTKVKLPKGVTKDQLQAWKEEHGEGNVKLLSLPKDDNDTEFLDVVVIVPTRRIMGLFEKFMDKDPDKSKSILINNCLLTSNEAVLADDGLFMTCANGIANLMPIRKAIVKNL